MQMVQSPSPRIPPEVAPHDEHGSRWKLGPFTWRLWRRSAATGNLRPGISSPITSSLHDSIGHNVSSNGESLLPEFFAAALLQEYELHDAALVEARRRLEVLEADPDTDELPLVMARHEVFNRKHNIAQTLTGA
jgi:hypothetical protein